MTKIKNKTGIKFYIYLIIDLLRRLNIRKNFYRNVGFFGILMIISGGTYYLFYTDTEIEYHDYATFPDPVTMTPKFYIFISYVT